MSKMRKLCKFMLGVLCVGMISASAGMIAACDDDSANRSRTHEEQYNLYVAYAEENGESPMTYEQWLDTIRGADGSTISTGVGQPLADLGKPGDLYLDTTTFDLYSKNSSGWTLIGNIKGQDGKDGQSGQDGAAGQDGEDGEDGRDGATWTTGQGQPSSDGGNDGDLYLDTEDYTVYVKEDGAWQSLGSIRGQDGQNGQNGADSTLEDCTVTTNADGSTTITFVWRDGERTQVVVPAQIAANNIISCQLMVGESNLMWEINTFGTKYTVRQLRADQTDINSYLPDGDPVSPDYIQPAVTPLSKMHTAEDVPETDIGADGDLCAVSSRGLMYHKLEGEWKIFGRICDNSGNDFFSGSMIKSAQTVVLGPQSERLYITCDGATVIILIDGYAHAESGELSVMPGAVMYYGSGLPEAQLGSDGDLFIDDASDDAYCKINGEWKLVGECEGEVGIGDYMPGTVLNMNVGYNNYSHPASVTYQDGELVGNVTMPDGKIYSTGSLRPAWRELADTLDIDFVDRFTNYSADMQITEAVSTNRLGEYDLLTGSVSAINLNTSYFINLNDYIDYMPNYKAFLEANPAIQYSLTGDTDTGAMYYAPYFDGINDIEKYTLAEKSWIENILNAEEGELEGITTTFAQQGAAKGYEVDATKASATSYMGTTGSWEVETTAADGTSVTMAKVDYNAALSAAKSTSTPLGQAYYEVVGSAYAGTSGNIVDIQNAAINATNGQITGGQLTKMLQAYIDAAYTLDGSPYANRADVFNSVSAAWDVDLMVALMRCVVSSPELIGESAANIGNLYGVSARQGTTQRRIDITALAGELYGIRGMESRFEYLYINSEGEIVDARQNASSYNLVSRFSALADEGLLYTGESNVQANRDTANGPSPLFMHDYVQTQTTAGFSDEDFNVAPIVTPVSKWDTDDNGSRETIMRFTESWRSIKNLGICIPKEVENDRNKLGAALAFIDYTFSNDGMISMTFGPMSSTGNVNPDGWWYATEADVDIDDVAYRPAGSSQYTILPEYEAQYFVYKNVVYNGMTDYLKAIPAVTTDCYNLFRGEEVNGFRLGENTTIYSSYSYTNFGRWVIGSTLPFGVKNQGLEYQFTAQCGLDGTSIVSQAVANGTIKHLTLSLEEGQSPWYLIAPTCLPLTAVQQTVLNTDRQTLISWTYFHNSSRTDQRTNVYLDIAFYGFDTTQFICGSVAYGNMLPDAQSYVDWIASAGLDERVEIFTDGWERVKLCYNII